jgi:hypothetical protein
MCSLLSPPHLLLIDHPLGDHLIHNGLDKACRNPFSITITLAVIGDELLIVGDVGLELFNRLQQLYLFRTGLVGI